MKQSKGPLSNLKIPDVKLPKIKLPNMPNLSRFTKADLSKMFKDLTSALMKWSSSGGGPSRPMKFPYTFSAKIAQFPYMHYYKNNWMAKYYVWGVLCSMPIFWKISQKANSKENKAKWQEIKRKEMEEHLH